MRLDAECGRELGDWHGSIAPKHSEGICAVQERGALRTGVGQALLLQRVLLRNRIDSISIEAL